MGLATPLSIKQGVPTPVRDETCIRQIGTERVCGTGPWPVRAATIADVDRNGLLPTFAGISGMIMA